MPYSNSTDEVLRYAKMITAGTGRADPVQTPDVTKYMTDADEIIESALAPMYAIPLDTITRGTRSNIYPDPIPLIAKRLSAGLLIKNVYSEIEPNISAKGEDERVAAMDMLMELISGIVGGTTRLLGQRLKSRNRFIPPGVAPHELPRTAVPAPTV